MKIYYDDDDDDGGYRFASSLLLSSSRHGRRPRESFVSLSLSLTRFAHRSVARSPARSLVRHGRAFALVLCVARRIADDVFTSVPLHGTPVTRRAVSAAESLLKKIRIPFLIIIQSLEFRFSRSAVIIHPGFIFYISRVFFRFRQYTY